MKKFFLILMSVGMIALLFSSCAKKCDCKVESVKGDRPEWWLAYPENYNVSGCGDLEKKILQELEDDNSNYKEYKFEVSCQMH